MGQADTIDFTMKSVLGDNIFDTTIDTCFLATTLAVTDNAASMSGKQATIYTVDPNEVGTHTVDFVGTFGVGIHN